MTLADLHQMIVTKARAKGLRQCKATLFEYDEKWNTTACCERGLLMEARMRAWITEDQEIELKEAFSKANPNSSIEHRNDIDGWTWDDFTAQLRRQANG